MSPRRTSHSNSAASRPETISSKPTSASEKSRSRSLKNQTVPSGIAALEIGKQTAAWQASGARQ